MVYVWRNFIILLKNKCYNSSYFKKTSGAEKKALNEVLEIPNMSTM